MIKVNTKLKDISPEISSLSDIQKEFILQQVEAIENGKAENKITLILLVDILIDAVKLKEQIEAQQTQIKTLSNRIYSLEGGYVATI